MRSVSWLMFFLSVSFSTFFSSVENEEEKALRAINKVRSETRKCGSVLTPSSNALLLDSCLTLAAAAHANDIYQNRFKSHEGSDGSTPFSRVSRFTNSFMRVGEAIAFSEEDFSSALELLLESPAHCKIITDNKFTHFGMSSIPGSREASNGGFVLVFAGKVEEKAKL